MYSYWFVGQAVMNQKWLDKNGDGWRAGRVEVTDLEGDSDFSCAELFMIYRPASPEFEDFIDDLPPTEDILTVYELAEMWGGDIEIWEAEL